MNKQGTKIVSIGAGTGQASVLQGISMLPNLLITALVTTTDNGGSSATIRRALGIPAPGDVRNVINAVNPKQDLLSKLLRYRFSQGELSGTHLGNLIVGALTDLYGSYENACKALNEELQLPVRILPVSNHATDICAELIDGTLCEGEWQIIKREKKDTPIKRYYLASPGAALQEGIDAIRDADLILICPGVLGTGIISVLLFEGIQQAIQASGAKIISISNVMTYPSQTDNFTLSEHINLLEPYLGKKVDTVIYNTTPPPVHILEQYTAIGATVVINDTDNLSRYELVPADLLIAYDAPDLPAELVRATHPTQLVGAHLIRHDGDKVAQAIKKLLAS